MSTCSGRFVGQVGFLGARVRVGLGLHEDLASRDFDLAIGERDSVELGLGVEPRDDADALRRGDARADGVLHAAVLLPVNGAAGAYDLRGRDEIGRQAEEGHHQVLQQRVEAFLHLTGVSRSAPSRRARTAASPRPAASEAPACGPRGWRKRSGTAALPRRSGPSHEAGRRPACWRGP